MLSTLKYLQGTKQKLGHSRGINIVTWSLINLIDFKAEHSGKSLTAHTIMHTRTSIPLFRMEEEGKLLPDKHF